MMQVNIAEFGDGLIARERSGELDPVLWIHGYTLNSSAWLPLWERMPGWKHIGIDLPSHGQSRSIRDGESLSSLAGTIGELALARGVRHIVALSFGTIVATQAAIEFPDSFASVTLGAPALAGGPQDPEVEGLYRELFELAETRGIGPHLQQRWMTAPPPLFYGADSRPDLWNSLWEIGAGHSWSELTGNRMFQLINTRQSERELKRITAAFLILVGDSDMPAFRRCGELICRSVPTSRRVYLNDTGHLCMLQDPDSIAP
ncbi:MAG: alpha/beta hydrolase, partial [Bryobacteraceae bacterium]|nr:alpha/beta hydrolase [Bryobacteraceae bacterium]